MLIAETLLTVSMLCTMPKRRSNTEWVANDNQSTNCFQLATGRSLEGKLKSELEQIQGVVGVSIENTGAEYLVTVKLQDLEFSVYDQVIQQELQLLDKHPDKTFTFDISAVSVDFPLMQHAA